MRMIKRHILLLIILMILSLIKSLEETSTALFQWFHNNRDKCHSLISSNENRTVKTGKYEI